MSSKTAFVLDLDGTLVDSVYQHVLAWREALAAAGRAHTASIRIQADLLRHLDELGVRAAG